MKLVKGPPLTQQGKENAGDKRVSFIVKTSDKAFDEPCTAKVREAGGGYRGAQDVRSEMSDREVTRVHEFTGSGILGGLYVLRSRRCRLSRKGDQYNNANLTGHLTGIHFILVATACFPTLTFVNLAIHLDLATIPAVARKA